MKSAREHVSFCIKLHKIQHATGRYFQHEHPQSARSWTEVNMQSAENLAGVTTVHAHMCEFGMKIMRSDGTNAKVLVLKPTWFFDK